MNSTHTTERPAHAALQSRPIPAVPVEQWQQLSAQAHNAGLPLVIRGLFSEQAARWSPERLATEFGQQQVGVVVDLPAHGVPYRERSQDYQRLMKLTDFVPLLHSGKSCYLNQAPLRDYPALERELDVPGLALGRVFALNLWVGSKTRSGLHFDNADNLFGQIYGKKRALLVGPAHSRYLYPFADNPSKSRIDLEAPDLARYPKCSRAEIWECALEPGDALYMPRGWWHHIASEDVSISVNCWHGDSLSELEYIRLSLAGGLRVVGRAVYDFFWHGVMRRPYRYRLFSPEPPGIKAYNRIKPQRARSW